MFVSSTRRARSSGGPSSKSTRVAKAAKLDVAVEKEKKAMEKAQASVDKLDKKYKGEKEDCSWRPKDWGHCVKAAALKVAVETARGVLKAADKVYRAAVEAIRKGSKTAIEFINNAMKEIGQAISTVADKLTTVIKKGASVLAFAARLAAKELREIAEVFEVIDVRVLADLAVLKLNGGFDLRVRYRLFGHEHEKSIAWNLKKSLQNLVGLLKPSKNDEPVVSDSQREVAQLLLDGAAEKDGSLAKGVPMPFDAQTCETHGYDLDAQLLETRTAILAQTKKLAGLKTPAEQVKMIATLAPLRAHLVELLGERENPASVCGLALRATGKVGASPKLTAPAANAALTAVSAFAQSLGATVKGVDPNGAASALGAARQLVTQQQTSAAQALAAARKATAAKPAAAPADTSATGALKAAFFARAPRRQSQYAEAPTKAAGEDVTPARGYFGGEHTAKYLEALRKLAASAK